MHNNGRNECCAIGLPISTSTEPSMTSRPYPELSAAAKSIPAVARKEGLHLQLQLVADMLNRSTDRPVDTRPAA